MPTMLRGRQCRLLAPAGAMQSPASRTAPALRDLSEQFTLPEPWVPPLQTRNRTCFISMNIHVCQAPCLAVLPGHIQAPAALTRWGLGGGFKQGCKFFSTPPIQRWSLITVPCRWASLPDSLLSSSDAERILRRGP